MLLDAMTEQMTRWKAEQETATRTVTPAVLEQGYLGASNIEDYTDAKGWQYSPRIKSKVEKAEVVDNNQLVPGADPALQSHKRT